MLNRHDSKAVEYSCRVYRRLLTVYPKSHREEYGAAMLQLFRDQCRDAWSARRIHGLIGFWLRAMADLLKTSVLEHVSNFKWSRIMLISFRPTIKPLPAFFGICALVFLSIFLASVLITFMIPEAFVGAATVLISRPTSTSDTTWAGTEGQVISSSAVLERVGKNLDLQVVWGKKYNNGQPLNVVDVVALLKSRLELSFVEPASGSAVSIADSIPLHIRAYSDDPQEAAKIANGVVDAYRAFRLEENRQAGATSMERSVTVLDLAVPAYRPVRPNKQLNIVIGALAGILIGVIIAPLILGFVTSIRKNRNAPGIPQKA